MLQTCNRCGKDKPLEAFNRQTSRPSGRKTICQDCTRKQGLDYYQLHRKRIIKRAVKWSRDNPERAKENSRASKLKRKAEREREQQQQQQQAEATQ